MVPISFKRHRFPPAVIQHPVWLYARFTLSFRDFEEFLAERGIDVSNETVRRWFVKFGRLIANNLRRTRPRPSARWHLEPVQVLPDEYQVSYLLVAHDLAPPHYLADHVAVMYLGSVVEMGPSEAIFGDPKHPYTQALFSATLPLRPDSDQNEIILQGEVPSPLDPPSGCTFPPRCHRKLGPICEREEPVRKAWFSTS